MSIVINDLHVELAGKHILRGVNLEVADGQRVGIIGPSGSGKSMIVRAILGLLPHGAQVSGSIRLFGEELLTYNERMLADIRGSYIGTIFQNPSMSLNPVLTVRQQVSLPLRLHYDLNRSEVQARVRRVLTQVGLGEAVENKFPSQLSGGQQQRVAIATALVTAPKLILADEPTTALDSINQLSVIHLLTRLVDEAGASMLFVTHDFGVLKKSCQYSYVISDGKVVENGYTHDLLEAPTQLLTQQLVHAAQALTLDEGMQGSALQADCSVQFGQETFDEEHE